MPADESFGMSDALAGAYQGRIEPRAYASRSVQSVAILEVLAKAPPGEPFSHSRYELCGITLQKELFTLAA